MKRPIESKVVVDALLDDPTPDMLDDPTPDMLDGVKPLYYHYDIHIGGDHDGCSVFVETRVPPPPGAQFNDQVDDPVRGEVVRAAVSQGDLFAFAARDVDYVALITPEEWTEATTGL